MQFIVKIVVSEVDFRVGTADQRLHESGYAAYSQTSGTRAIFSENFSSIRCALSSPLEQNKNKKVNMPPHMNPKTLPRVSKMKLKSEF